MLHKNAKYANEINVTRNTVIVTSLLTVTDLVKRLLFGTNTDVTKENILNILMSIQVLYLQFHFNEIIFFLLGLEIFSNMSSYMRLHILDLKIYTFLFASYIK